jgi:catecholate siderophore receptor
MTEIKKNRVAAPAFLALSCIGAIATSQAAFAQDSQQKLGGMTVTDTAIEEEAVKVDKVESPKATQPLLDTPQTITVISDVTIRKQNLLTLRDVLQTVPGITFGAGEGGGGYGDSINLRGYSANNDLTQDGVRDSAQYSRTDPFNTQQIEVYNGANSVFNGSGSVGGTINLASKTPKAEDLTILEAGVGTDNYYRATVDANKRLSDLVAVRVNAMYHRNDVPGRDVEKYKRWGVAPSITIGIDSPTSLTLSYLHQKDDNTPIYGVPYFKNEINEGPLPGVDRSDYFGIANLDKQESTVDRFTATFAHEFSDNVSIRNLTRWQRVAQFSQTSAPQGTFCLSGTGRQPITTVAGGTTGAACSVSFTNVVDSAGVYHTTANPLVVAVPAGFFQPNGPRGLVRDQVNDLMFNQTDLRIVSGEEGGVRNTLVVGASLSWEDYSITSASLARNSLGQAFVLPQISLADPETDYTGPINFTVTAKSRSHSRNKAIYAFDTLELGMFELNGGVRYENAHGNFRNLALPSYPPGTTPLTAAGLADQVNDENLFSYRAGLVFKPTKDSSLYISYANAKTPSSATVRLGCGTVTTSAAGVADPCAVAPEKARNYEIGGKVDLFDKKMQATIALFRNERSNYRVTSNDPALPTSLQVLDGESRVDGLALGLSGNITPDWSIFANYTYLKSKLIQSVSNACLATPSVACANRNASGTLIIADPAAGDELIQTPKHSGSLFTTYTLPFGLQIGYGFTYQGSFALNQSVLLNQVQFRSKDYLTHRAFVSYNFNNGLTAQINVQNFTNEKYYTGIRNNITAATGVVSGGWATPGEARAARLSLFYSF